MEYTNEEILQALDVLEKQAIDYGKVVDKGLSLVGKGIKKLKGSKWGSKAWEYAKPKAHGLLDKARKAAPRWAEKLNAGIGSTLAKAEHTLKKS